MVSQFETGAYSEDGEESEFKRQGYLFRMLKQKIEWCRAMASKIIEPEAGEENELIVEEVEEK